MNCRLPIADCRFSWRSSRPGFSFTEILFAVMILGIGFIMVAAMFPVAIQQTQATAEESVGASVGRAGVDYMQQLAATRVVLPTNHPLAGAGGRPVVIPASTAEFSNPTSILLPTLDPIGLPVSTTVPPPPYYPLRIPGQVWSLHEHFARDGNLVTLAGTSLPHPTALWDVSAQNLILPADPRHGMVLMYKRDLIAQASASGAITYTPAPDAQIIVIAVRSRGKDAYDATDVVQYQGNPASLEPQLSNAGANQAVQIQRQGINSFITIRDGAAARVAEGAYIVIANDGLGLTTPTGVAIIGPSANGTGGLYAGHIFQIGTQQGTSNTWNLAPGNDLGPTDPAGSVPFRNPQVLIVGRSYINNTATGGGFSGLAQDVGVYTGFIPVN